MGVPPLGFLSFLYLVSAIMLLLKNTRPQFKDLQRNLGDCKPNRKGNVDAINFLFTGYELATCRTQGENVCV